MLFQKGMDFIKNNPQMMIVLIVAIIAGIVIMSRSTFKNTLITPPTQFETNAQPMSFTKLSQDTAEGIHLAEPVVPEEKITLNLKKITVTLTPLLKNTTKKQCLGFTKSGAQCKREIKVTETYCYQHKN